MGCYYPLLGLRGAVNANGKRPLTIYKSSLEITSPYIKSAIAENRVVMIPCGKCAACRLERSRQWAVRCVHEAQMHDDNVFVTLTFNAEHLPKDGSVNKRDLQLFLKRLRKHFEPKEIRFFACGEYGDKGGRPHYHACLFGVKFDDREVIFEDPQRRFRRFKQAGPEHTLYKSETLTRLWGQGFCSIGELTFESAAYVARYVMKKITGAAAEKHYGKRQPEFALMSRRNGIGFSWFEKYRRDVYPKDFTTVRGIKQKPPRYYDYLLEMSNPKLLEDIKEVRRLKAIEIGDGRRRLKERDRAKSLQIKHLIRSIE